MAEYSRRICLGAIAAISLLASGSALAARYMVLEVTGATPQTLVVSSVIPGLVLDIPRGSTVTLLAETEDVVRIIGPFKGNINDAPRGARNTTVWFSQWFTRAAAARGLGHLLATRGPLATSQVSDPLIVDVQHSGPQCVRAGVQPTLGGLQRDRDQRLSVRRMEPRAQTFITWPAGALTIPWPAEVPTSDGAIYTLAVTTLPLPPTEIVLREVSDAEAGLALVRRLAELHCDLQAVRAARLLAVDRTVTMQPSEP